MRYSTGMRRCRSAGKTGHSQIETAPEKMHRAAFATKLRSKFSEHQIALQKHAPKSICIFGVVGAVFLVTLKTNRVHNLIWRGVDFHGDAQLVQRFHHCSVKLCHGLGLELQHSEAAVTGED